MVVPPPARGRALHDRTGEGVRGWGFGGCGLVRKRVGSCVPESAPRRPTNISRAERGAHGLLFIL